MKNKLLILGAIFISVGCGIKGDPLPPVEQESIQKQSPPSLEVKKEVPATVTPATKKKSSKKEKNVKPKTSDEN